MGNHILLCILLVWFLAPGIALAGDPDSSGTRWGITTKKNLEKMTAPAGDESVAAPAADAAPHPSTDGNHEGAGKGTAGAEKPQQPVPESTGQTNPPDRSEGSVGKAARPPSEEKSLSSKESTQEPTKSRMVWSSENQKQTCTAHLTNLRQLFLETRHFSIQGASCDTAESAKKLLALIEQCRQDCPDHFLEQNGYSHRIIRNIRYLERLGKDRCGDTIIGGPSE